MIVVPENINVGDIARHYDTFDPLYRMLWGRSLHHDYRDARFPSADETSSNLIRATAPLLEPKTGDQILDVGCGYGITTKYLAQRYDCQVTGVTVSTRQHEIACRDYRSPRIIFRLGDWMKMPDDPNRFDRIISIECLCHIPDKQGFFDKLSTNLKPGGRAVITTLAASDHCQPWAKSLLIQPLCRAAQFPNLAHVADLSRWACRRPLRLLRNENITVGIQQTWTAIAFRSLKHLVVSGHTPNIRLKLNQATNRLGWAGLRLWTSYLCGAIQYRLLVVQKTD